jgi:hypothetical protein
VKELIPVNFPIFPAVGGNILLHPFCFGRKIGIYVKSKGYKE